MALYNTFEAMRKVNRPDQLDWRRVSSVQNVAWKTGTSYGSRDAWAIGLTPDYAVGVWVGNADGSGTPNLTGARTAGPVLFDLVNLLPFSEWFSKPVNEGIEITVCCHSGHSAGKFCNETININAPESASESAICPYCRPVHLSVDGKYQVIDRSEQTQIKNMFTLPPAMEYYYRQSHPEYISLPPIKTDDNSSGHDKSPMRFLYPAEGSIVKIPRQLDGSEGRITVNVVHSDSSMELFWHCDGNYIGVTRDIHTMSLDLFPDFHQISVVDSQGHSIKVGFTVL